MKDTNSSSEKRIVDELSFGAKTAKRVSWESFEFTVEAPHLVRVTNVSYGFEKDNHSYLVGVEERDGRVTPAECECPADKYNDQTDCKHKVALAAEGGPVVLNAAVDFENAPPRPFSNLNRETATDKLQTDGGLTTEGTEPKACPNGDPRCDGPEGDALPCFACYEVDE
jgi:hypothetical protein